MPDPDRPIDRKPFVLLAISALFWGWAGSGLAENVDGGSSARLESGAPGAARAAGFIYGRVETRYRAYEGRLRWDQEAFWDQYLDSNKERVRHAHLVPVESRVSRSSFSFFGAEGSHGRLRSLRRGFMARFGDIAVIEPHSRGWSTVTMRDGTRYELEGGGDIWSKLRIYDAEEGEIELAWERIRRIVFLPTPEDLAVEEGRLAGTVTTPYGTFRGAIQWDQDESTTSDELDGEDEWGKRQAIPMGEIRSLENLGNRTGIVLRNGEEFELDGTNDVNRGNRGIWVHDARYGRVSIPWSSFERLEFDDPELEDGSGVTGPSFADFLPGRALEGRVERQSGGPVAGRIVWDVDEERSWEVFNGELLSQDGAGPRRPMERPMEAEGEARDEALGEEASRPGKAAEDMQPGIEIEIGDSDRGAPRAVHGDSGGPGDSSEPWRTLLEYDIPFERIARVERLPDNEEGDGRRTGGRVEVHLWGGEALILGGTQDVNERNAGILVFPHGGGEAVFVDWADVSEVVFEPPAPAGEPGTDGVDG